VTKESRALLSSLATQRDHVLGILEGLSEEDLRRPMLPSQWTCAGLVHHLAIDVERFWFRAVVAGEKVPGDEPGDLWQVPAGRPVRLRHHPETYVQASGEDQARGRTALAGTAGVLDRIMGIGLELVGLSRLS
jgi:hypothetical protein